MDSKLIHCYGRGDAVSSDAVKINVTSKSTDEAFKKLSPFYLGPCSITPFSDENVVSQSMENAWQYSKFFKKHEQKDGELDAYKKWANAGWQNTKANRFPMGRGAKPLFSLHQGKRIGYIEARFSIYAPVYAAAVKEHASDSWQKLVELCKTCLEENKHLWMFDFDGYDHIGNGLSLKQVLYNPKRKMGHGFVLAMMLQEEISGDPAPWKEGFDKSLIATFSAKKAKLPDEKRAIKRKSSQSDEVDAKKSK